MNILNLTLSYQQQGTGIIINFWKVQNSLLQQSIKVYFESGPLESGVYQVTLEPPSSTSTAIDFLTSTYPVTCAGACSTTLCAPRPLRGWALWALLLKGWRQGGDELKINKQFIAAQNFFGQAKVLLLNSK